MPSIAAIKAKHAYSFGVMGHVDRMQHMRRRIHGVANDDGNRTVCCNVYSSDRRRAAGLVTLTPSTFALDDISG